MAKPRRMFTPEYKAEVVQLVLAGGKSIGQVARDLDLTESAGRTWVHKARAMVRPPGSAGLNSDQGEELKRLRQEVRQLRLERDILKKATAFFVRESS